MHLIALCLWLFLSSVAQADTFETSYNTTQWVPVIILDSTNQNPTQGVTASAVTFWYKKGRAGTWTQLTLAGSCTLASGNWCEDDATNAAGSYRVGVANTIVDTKGDFYYLVKGSGYKTYWGWLKNKTYTSDIESDNFRKAKATECQITAATSGSSFTISSCVDHDGNAITLQAENFDGVYMTAINRAATQCNVVGQGVFVDSMTSGGVVTVRTTDMANAKFPATPNTTNCNVRIQP